MLSSLIASIASGEATEAVRRVRSAVIAYLLAAVAGLCGVGFLIGAGFSATAQIYGTVYAALAFAGGFIVLAILVLIVHRIMQGARKRRIARRRAEDARAMAQTAAMVILPALIARGGVGSLVAPVLAFAAYAIYRENTPRRDDSDKREKK
jgi:cytochrome c biogenesis protein CcdA